MTFDELNQQIQVLCRNNHGLLDREMLSQVIELYGKDLTPEERYRLYWQLVYDRSSIGGGIIYLE